MFYVVTTGFRWHAEQEQVGKWWRCVGMGRKGGDGKEQSKQELIENKTTCPKEIISCQCGTNKKINLSFVRAKSMADRKQGDCSSESCDWLSASRGIGSMRLWFKLNDRWQRRDSHRQNWTLKKNIISPEQKRFPSFPQNFPPDTKQNTFKKKTCCECRISASHWWQQHQMLTL